MPQFITDDYLEIIWKESVVADLKIISRHALGGTETKYKELRQHSSKLAEIRTRDLPNTSS
jgi:hypothetical protein